MTSPLKIKPVKPLAMGWIPYWNLLPLGEELRRQGAGEYDFQVGAPALVNKLLRDGKVSLAPCSSICLLKNATNDLAFPMGVAAKGPVQSVYIGFHRDGMPYYDYIRERQQVLKGIVKEAKVLHRHEPRHLAEAIWSGAARTVQSSYGTLPTLALTPASATSATLTRVLGKLWFGSRLPEVKQRPDNVDMARDDDPAIELLIGDEALIRRPSFAAVIDLSEAWRELTGLPFVFAVWQKGPGTMSPYWRTRIMEAAELAQAKMHVDPSVYLPDSTPGDMVGHRIDLAQYWKGIRYRLTDSDMRGLLLFLCLARQLAPAKFGQESIARILRWDAQRQSNSTL